MVLAQITLFVIIFFFTFNTAPIIDEDGVDENTK